MGIREKTPILAGILVVVLLFQIQSTDVDAQSPTIPEWLKSNALWWSEDKITDDEFVSGIEYMIENKIITSPVLQVSSQEGLENPNGKMKAGIKAPQWVKNSAEWWSAGDITNEDFVGGIEYLVSSNIIASDKIDVNPCPAFGTEPNSNPLGFIFPLAYGQVLSSPCADAIFGALSGFAGIVSESDSGLVDEPKETIWSVEKNVSFDDEDYYTLIVWEPESNIQVPHGTIGTVYVESASSLGPMQFKFEKQIKSVDNVFSYVFSKHETENYMDFAAGRHIFVSLIDVQGYSMDEDVVASTRVSTEFPTKVVHISKLYVDHTPERVSYNPFVPESIVDVVWPFYDDVEKPLKPSAKVYVSYTVDGDPKPKSMVAKVNENSEVRLPHFWPTEGHTYAYTITFVEGYYFDDGEVENSRISITVPEQEKQILAKMHSPPMANYDLDEARSFADATWYLDEWATTKGSSPEIGPIDDGINVKLEVIQNDDDSTRKEITSTTKNSAVVIEHDEYQADLKLEYHILEVGDYGWGATDIADSKLQVQIPCPPNVAAPNGGQFILGANLISLQLTGLGDKIYGGGEQKEDLVVIPEDTPCADIPVPPPALEAAPEEKPKIVTTGPCLSGTLVNYNDFCVIDKQVFYNDWAYSDDQQEPDAGWKLMFKNGELFTDLTFITYYQKNNEEQRKLWMGEPEHLGYYGWNFYFNDGDIEKISIVTDPSIQKIKRLSDDTAVDANYVGDGDEMIIYHSTNPDLKKVKLRLVDSCVTRGMFYGYTGETIFEEYPDSSFTVYGKFETEYGTLAEVKSANMTFVGTATSLWRTYGGDISTSVEDFEITERIEAFGGVAVLFSSRYNAEVDPSIPHYFTMTSTPESFYELEEPFVFNEKNFHENCVLEDEYYEQYRTHAAGSGEVSYNRSTYPDNLVDYPLE